MRWIVSAALLILALSPVAARADLETGALAPDIEAKQWLHLEPEYFDKYFPGGKGISIRELRGMVVVLYFWVSYHGGGEYTMPLMTIVENNPNLGRQRGVFVMGVTDSDPSRIRPMLERNKTFIPVACESKSGEDYRIQSWPRVVIIDANGKVAWNGWPGQNGGEELVKAVLDVVSKTPPTKTHPVEAMRANELLDEARDSLRKDEFRKALKAAKTANEHALKGDKLKAATQDMVDLVEALARDRLAQAEKLLSDKKYVEGINTLRTVLRHFKGTAAFDTAEQRLEDLGKDNEQAAEILEQQQNASEASLKLAKAIEDLKARRFGVAYEGLEAVTTEYKGTDSAEDAQEIMERIKKRDSIMQFVRDHKAKKPAESLLSQAANYKRLNRIEKAEELLRQVIREYGDTSYAEKARQELLDLR